MTGCDLIEVSICEQVIEVSGSPGAQGIQGASGSGASATTQLLFIAIVDGNASFPLPNINASVGVDLYINGIMQSRASFNATSTLLSIPEQLNVITGDVLSVMCQI